MSKSVGSWNACSAMLSLCTLLLCVVATDALAAPIHRSSEPIKDSSGRVEVIVDFDFDPDKDKEFDEVIADADYKPWAGHRTKAVKFLNQFP